MQAAFGAMARGARLLPALRAAAAAPAMGASAPSAAWLAAAARSGPAALARAFTTSRPLLGMEEFFATPLPAGKTPQKTGALPPGPQTTRTAFAAARPFRCSP